MTTDEVKLAILEKARSLSNEPGAMNNALHHVYCAAEILVSYAALAEENPERARYNYISQKLGVARSQIDYAIEWLAEWEKNDA